MRTRILCGLGLAITLAAGLAIAKPRNGELGVYLDDAGNVVGTYAVSCDGAFSFDGVRTANAVANGQIFCNPR